MQQEPDRFEGKQIYLSGQKRSITPYLKKLIKRRQAIEPHIGHMKADGKMKRNYLKGKKGDEISPNTKKLQNKLVV